MNPRIKEIMQLRFAEKKKLKEIAIIFGITHQRVSQIIRQNSFDRTSGSVTEFITRKCKQCKKDFITFKSLCYRNKFFCNQHCRSVFNLKRCNICKLNKEHLIISGKTKHCRECNTKRLKKYRHTPNGKEIIYRIIRKSEKKYPEKVKGRWKLREAVRQGKIVKPNKCSDCGKRKRLDGHHNDYSKPFDVIWLCRICHSDLHRKSFASIQITQTMLK